MATRLFRALFVAVAVGALPLLAGCDIRVNEGGGLSLGVSRGRASDEWTRTYTVGKAGRFDMAENIRALRAGSFAMDPRASGLYRRHHLEVAYLLDRQGLTIRQLYADPPDERALRARIMADKSH